MKLDSEEQRQDLLRMLSTVRATVTPLTIDQTKKEFELILDAVRNAELDEASDLKGEGEP